MVVSVYCPWKFQSFVTKVKNTNWKAVGIWLGTDRFPKLQRPRKLNLVEIFPETILKIWFLELELFANQLGFVWFILFIIFLYQIITTTVSYLQLHHLVLAFVR